MSIERVVVVVNRRKEVEPLLEFLRRRMSEAGILLQELPLPWHETTELPRSLPEPDRPDLALSLGGDGTLLFAARWLYGLDIPVIGINLGRFGFLTEITVDEMSEELDRVLCGDYGVQRRIMLEVCVDREGTEVARFHPLNEAVIGRGGIGGLVSLRTGLNGEFLSWYKADGLIISTPTGSTGYSLSANGPLLLPDMDNLIINPICPHSLSSRPLLVSGQDKITVSIEENETGAELSIDVQEGMALVPGDVVRISAAPKRLHLVKSSRRNFYQVLRGKLGWSNHG